MPPFVTPLFPYYAAYAVMSFLYKGWDFATDHDREALNVRFADADETNIETLLDREIVILSERAGVRIIARLRDQVETLHDDRQTGDRSSHISNHFEDTVGPGIMAAFNAFDAEHIERSRTHLLAMDARAYFTLRRLAEID